MSFSSLQFALFMTVVMTVYWALRTPARQNLFLLVASYVFYGSWDLRFLGLIWLLTLVSFGCGQAIAASADPTRRTLVLRLYIMFSLGVLGVFKYFNFFSDTALALAHSMGWQITPFYLDIVLPAAISFFTFESLSYVIEIHQRQIRGTTRLQHYALFIAFFPKLVAGPIERPAVLIPQIEGARHPTWGAFNRGAFLILFGLFKKVAIADGLAPSVNAVYANTEGVSGTDIALATAAFTVQIYCDFSGYTDIARGASKWLGFELSQNFRFPYFAKGPSEFWRRWHLSLSSWLRDYLFIPLGGSRGSEVSTRRNLLITMGLGGLWHGAAWNFVLWGLYQGALLVIGRSIRWEGAAFVASRPDGFATLRDGLRWILFILLVMYGWLLFRATSFDQISVFTTTLFTGPYPASTHVRPPLSALLGIPLLFIYDYLAYRSGWAAVYLSWPLSLSTLWISVMVVILLMGFSNASSAFIYFQF